MTSQPWQPSPWQVPADSPFAVPVTARLWRHPADTVVLALSTVFVALLGPAVGLIWSAAAPRLSIARVAANDETTFKSLIGADAWFLLVTALAGVFCALVAHAVRGRGPAVVSGLAIGGAIGALIADRVGYLATKHDVLQTLKPFGITLHRLQAAGIDPTLKVHALGVIVAWPLAALLTHALILSVTHSDS